MAVANPQLATITQLERPAPKKAVSILSPLRYPGSKRRLAHYIRQVLELNQLEPNLFVEPFAGGASVALQFANDGVVEKIGLIERDPLVADFWKTVFEDADWLIEKVRTIEVSVGQWREFKRYSGTERRQRALACLYLNRTSFSGILAPTAGPIGGYGQDSEYKIDCRFPRETLIRRIRQAALLADKVEFVWNLSWRRGLSLIRHMQANQSLANDIFFYFDPPFFEKADRLYSYYFKQRDHEALRDAVRELEDKWIMSYDSAAHVRQLYEDRSFGSSCIETVYSAASDRGFQQSVEVVISNLDILIDEQRIWGYRSGSRDRLVDVTDMVAAGGDG